MAVVGDFGKQREIIPILNDKMGQLVLMNSVFLMNKLSQNGYILLPQPVFADQIRHLRHTDVM